MRRHAILLLVLTSVLLCTVCQANAAEAEDLRQQAADNFQDWKFGIFIHWGVSSGHGSTVRALYAQERATHSIGNIFDERATHFDADQWVRTLQRSGARYITFTAKHHPGLCLFATEVTDYKTKRDYCSELAEACHKQEMPLFFYMMMGGEEWEGVHAWIADPKNANLDRQTIRQRIKQDHHPALKQYLLDLCERNQPTGFWFDGWSALTTTLGRIRPDLDPIDLYDLDYVLGPVRECKPDILLGNKRIIGGHFDYLVSERMFETRFDGPLAQEHMPSESCDFLPGSVWFSSHYEQKEILTPEEIEEQTVYFLKRLITCVGRGVNYLLGVGPLPDGELQNVEVAILDRMGLWLEKHGEAVYGTRACREIDEPWGYCVSKGDKWYLHIVDNRDIGKARGSGMQIGKDGPAYFKSGIPDDGKIVLKTDRRIGRAYLLSGGQSLGFRQNGDRLTLDLSGIEADPVDTLVVLEVENVDSRK